MYHCINPVVGKKLLYGCIIAAVDTFKRDIILSCDFLDPLKAGHIAIGHIVRDKDIIPGIDKLNSDVAADIARAS